MKENKTNPILSPEVIQDIAIFYGVDKKLVEELFYILHSDEEIKVEVLINIYNKYSSEKERKYITGIIKNGKYNTLKKEVRRKFLNYLKLID